MKPTDFAKQLTDFLSKYLPGERGLSINTISSYKFTFILFITFMEIQRKKKASKIELRDITKENVVAFLDWLQSHRRCSVATRNVRLAALHSFFRYLQYQIPENLSEWQKILSIKEKKSQKETISYLSVDGIKLLLEQPNRATQKGRRDLAMLALMYDCAARVQEIIDLEPLSLRLNKPFTIKIIGKGNKARIVPLMEEEIEHVHSYMKENGLMEIHRKQEPLFYNSRNDKLTRAGVNCILLKYATMARVKNPGLAAYAMKASKGITPFLIAVTDYMRPPLVSEINTLDYEGNVGDQIHVVAFDDFAVTEVKVSIFNPAGALIEKGDCVLNSITNVYDYTATVAVIDLTGVEIFAQARDYPGHVGANFVTL